MLYVTMCRYPMGMLYWYPDWDDDNFMQYFLYEIGTLHQIGHCFPFGIGTLSNDPMLRTYCKSNGLSPLVG